MREGALTSEVPTLRILILQAYRASRFSLFPEFHARDVEKSSDFREQETLHLDQEGYLPAM